MKSIKGVVLLITFLLLASGVWMQIRFAVTGDKDWLLFAAEELLAGKQFGVDVFEINPPLILWLYAAPAWIALHSALFADYVLLGISGVCAAGLVVRLSFGLIALHPAFDRDVKQQSIFAVMLFALFVCLTSPVYFFDRDNIMLLFTFPYMLRFMPSLADKVIPFRLRLAGGLLAAIGFSVKPHALLVFLALQAFYLVRARSFRALMTFENGIIIAFGALYCAIAAVCTPEYFHTVLPMALQTYSSYNSRGGQRLLLTLAFIFAGIPLLDFRPRYPTPYRRDAWYFMVIAVAYLAYALIGNGWGYTYNPLFSMLFFLTCWLLWEYGWLRRHHEAKGENIRLFKLGQRACTVSITLNVLYGIAGLYAAVTAYSCGGYSDCASNAPYLDYMERNSIASFGVMSGEFTRWPQIGWASGAKWETRFNHLWMVPAVVTAEAAHDNSLRWVVEYVAKAYAEDLSSHRPDAVFVDDSDEFFTYHRHVNILAVLNTVPEFARTWRYYRYDTEFNVCKSKDPKEFTALTGCRYSVYRRIDGASSVP